MIKYKFRFLIAAAIVLVLVIVIVALANSGNNDSGETADQIDISEVVEDSTPEEEQPANDEVETDDEEETSTSPKQEDEPIASDINPNTPITSPYGAFVSHHQPNLDGDPVSSSLSSICTTTPGASCLIRFIEDADQSNIKELPTKSTNKKGAAMWEWELSDVGLTEGTWTVQAIASIFDREVITEDPTKLEIGK